MSDKKCKPKKALTLDELANLAMRLKLRAVTEEYNNSLSVRPLRLVEGTKYAETFWLSSDWNARRRAWDRASRAKKQSSQFASVQGHLYQHEHALSKLIWDMTGNRVFVPKDVSIAEFRRIADEQREAVPESQRFIYDEVKWLLFRESGLQAKELSGLRPKIIQQILDLH